MNDRFFYAMSIRLRLPDNSRRHYLGMMTTKPNKVYFDWRFAKKDSITTSATVALSTAKSYGLMTFPSRKCIKDLNASFADYYRKTRGKSKDAVLQFAIETLDMRRDLYDLPQGAVVDWAQPIIGQIKYAV